MIAQYQAIKAEHPGTLLFFRMGDFYELFFEDAVQAAPALDIALTKRGRHEDEDIPMCGVPVHSSESYLEKLIRKGFKVAICEQMESPEDARKRSGKTLVRRDVVRIVTPGTLTEDSLLSARANNYLMAIGGHADRLAVAWVDISTGAFFTEMTSKADLTGAISRLSPGEILIADNAGDRIGLPGPLDDWKSLFTRIDPRSFSAERGESRLLDHFGIRSLDAFGAFERSEIAAAGALLSYLDLTQKGLLPRLDPPRRIENGTAMRIDPATRRNLELTHSLDGRRQGSLLASMDRTVTSAGGRLLAERLAAPLASLPPLLERLAEVEGFVEDAAAREDVRGQLRQMPDLARAVSRLSLDRGGPRDMVAIGRGLTVAGDLRWRLEKAAAPLARMADDLDPCDELRERLVATLDDQPPLLARDGGFVRSGALEELDEQRRLRDQGRRLIAELETRYREETGIPSLKIRHNNMLGFFIEVTSTHRSRVPDHFLQRQGMVNASRYSTDELGSLEERIAHAADKALALELEIYADLRAAIAEHANAIARTAAAAAALDIAAALGELAREQDYVMPRLTDGLDLDIAEGRHPVVEQSLVQAGERFQPNDAQLEGDQSLWLLTGPNMAGKSTFLRQTALIAIMAQTGSFVPAKSATIGLVDRLFSRVGAADDIARGRSTFMVEMVETATILNQAGERSLVILDEIGRGTATYDGLSLAWAVIEHLHDANRCRGLFATHYHELTALAARLDHLSPHFVRVKEWKGEVIFLHEVAAGSADRSYGIHVARLAGLPKVVIDRAQAVLNKLEAGEAHTAPARLAEDLPLFRAALEASRCQAEPSRPPPALERLRDLDPDEMTPRQALEALYTLRDLLEPE
ncbi:MAG: DNA mismatch repair protein MutS [Geminicoccaceae bacterium]|nr:DNA mismatch repair protein MutS [Geminicoccaceae bacterium]